MAEEKYQFALAVRTMQAKIRQTIALIEREKQKRGKKCKNTGQMDILIQRYQLQEKELYALYTIEKNRRLVEWIEKLNKLDYSRATRKFYKEIRSKNKGGEQFGQYTFFSGGLDTF